MQYVRIPASSKVWSTIGVQVYFVDVPRPVNQVQYTRYMDIFLKRSFFSSNTRPRAVAFPLFPKPGWDLLSMHLCRLLTCVSLRELYSGHNASLNRRSLPQLATHEVKFAELRSLV